RVSAPTQLSAVRGKIPSRPDAVGEIKSPLTNSGSLYDSDKSLCRGREAPPPWVYQPNVPLHLPLFYLHLLPPAVTNFMIHAHSRQEGYAFVALHHLSDCLDGRHL